MRPEMTTTRGARPQMNWHRMGGAGEFALHESLAGACQAGQGRWVPSRQKKQGSQRQNSGQAKFVPPLCCPALDSRFLGHEYTTSQPAMQNQWTVLETRRSLSAGAVSLLIGGFPRACACEVVEAAGSATSSNNRRKQPRPARKRRWVGLGVSFISLDRNPLPSPWQRPLKGPRPLGVVWAWGCPTGLHTAAARDLGRNWVTACKFSTNLLLLMVRARRDADCSRPESFNGLVTVAHTQPRMVPVTLQDTEDADCLHLPVSRLCGTVCAGPWYPSCAEMNAR